MFQDAAYAAGDNSMGITLTASHTVPFVLQDNSVDVSLAASYTHRHFCCRTTVWMSLWQLLPRSLDGRALRGRYLQPALENRCT